MDKIDDGGPAFPRPYQGDDGNLTVRDWMAGQALAGLMASRIDEPSREMAARWAYGLADAMLVERAKGRVTG
jgi:hypothetical protein